jgi:hypothetical protein
VPPSHGFHNGPDCADNDLRLLDCHDMTGLRSHDLTAALGEPDLIALQVSPRRVGAPCAHDNHDGNRQPAPRALDFRGALLDVSELVSGRLVSSGAEPRRTRESTD